MNTKCYGMGTQLITKPARKPLALHGDEGQPGANESNSFLGFEEAPLFGWEGSLKSGLPTNNPLQLVRVGVALAAGAGPTGVADFLGFPEGLGF